MLRQAAGAGDSDTLWRVAHTLKGQSSAIGARAMVTMSTRLESLGKSGELSSVAVLIESLENEFHREYLTKPYQPKEVLERLGNCLDRRNQPAPEHPVAPQRRMAPYSPSFHPPPFVGVFIASSTGGKDALTKILGTLEMQRQAAVFIVQHGPAWLLEALAVRLQGQTTMPLVLAEDGMYAKAGTVYLAPGDHHLSIKAGTFRLRLEDGPLENYVRPAADPLFRNGAHAFRPYGIGVVLTGMGRDGAAGAAHILKAGGTVLVQDPETAVAPGMPKNVIEMGGATEVTGLVHLGRTSTRHVGEMAVGLNAALDQAST